MPHWPLALVVTPFSITVIYCVFAIFIRREPPEVEETEEFPVSIFGILFPYLEIWPTIGGGGHYGHFWVYLLNRNRVINLINA